MARKKNSDCSSEILAFRQCLSAAISRRIDSLEYEIGRVDRLSHKLPDRPVVEVGGRIDLTQFDPRKGKKRERIKSGRIATVEEKADVPVLVKKIDLYLRRDSVESFLDEARAFVTFVRTISLQCSTLQYAILKKEIADLNCDESVFKPYSGNLPTLDEMTTFLISSYQFDDQFTREYLTKLSNQHNSILVLSAVCDNLRGKEIDIEKAKSSITSAILSLGNEQVPFSKGLEAYIVALKSCRFRDFNYYISTAQKVTWESLLGNDFPHYCQSDLGLDIISDEKEKYLTDLQDVLEDARVKELFTQEEFSAIEGREEQLLSSDGKQKRPSQNQGKEQDMGNGSPIECPEVFKKKPDALRRFYRLLVENGYISVDEDSFLYWFNSLRIDNDKVNRIIWLKGVTDDIKCFIEALYPLHGSYIEFKRVFVCPNGKELSSFGGDALVYRAVASKRIKVSDLPYDGRRGQKNYNKQKKIIDDIKNLIKLALTEQ